ncbi:MAG: hypothetical protein FWE33_03260 [Defluviitaleaceae bacterium]|nr:hypothetical protein [Defluviitaleaceae bacterium]
MYKYRRCGIGNRAFYEVLDTHKGKWQVLYHPNNIASASFWERAIDERTNSKYEQIKSHTHEDYRYEDGSFGNVMYFENNQHI